MALFLPKKPLSPKALLTRVGIVAGIGVAAAVAMLLTPKIPQDPHYHTFADRRTILGIPNFFDVTSNLPFAAVGVMGLALLLRSRRGGGEEGAPRFLNNGERRAFAVLFAGAVLLTLGSGYYHLAPNNERLMWDRLPMAIVFMALFAITIGERVHPKLTRMLLWPLVGIGVGSVLYWRATDDLRAYGLVQFYPALAVPLLLLLFPPSATGGRFIALALGSYAVAKLFETFDEQILALGGVVSGHTLKHLAAAGSVYFIYRMAAERRPLAEGEGAPPPSSS
jgi:hypothetical protein